MAPFRPDIRPGGRRGSVEVGGVDVWGVCLLGGAEEGWAMTGTLL